MVKSTLYESDHAGKFLDQAGERSPGARAVRNDNDPRRVDDW